jgi:hypothetical protein
MYYDTICKNIQKEYTKEDIHYNRKEIIFIFNKMIAADAETKYPDYELYKDIFHTFAFDIIEKNNILNFKTQGHTFQPFIENDKKLLVRPKSKTVIDMFSKVEKI